MHPPGCYPPLTCVYSIQWLLWNQALKECLERLSCALWAAWKHTNPQSVGAAIIKDCRRNGTGLLVNKLIYFPQFQSFDVHNPGANLVRFGWGSSSGGWLVGDCLLLMYPSHGREQRRPASSCMMLIRAQNSYLRVPPHNLTKTYLSPEGLTS